MTRATETRSVRSSARDVRAVLSRRPWITPLAVFVAWRTAHAAAVVALGGDPVQASFQFDAGYYLEIAQRGYTLTDPTYETFQTTAFFPAFPALAAPFVRVLGPTLGGLIVANTLAAGAFVTMWAYVRRVLDDRTALVALVLLACWPGSFFLWAFYGEALFIAATAGALLADRAGARWRWLAIGLTLIAGLTRSVGVFFGPVLFAARWWRTRRVDRWGFGYVLASLAALGALLVIMQLAVGDPLAFSTAQRAWGRTPSTPWVPTLSTLDHVVTVWPDIAFEALLYLAIAASFLGLGVWGTLVAWREGRNGPTPPELGLWTLVAAAVPHFASLLSGIMRFVVSSWTGFVLIAVALRDRRVIRWTCYLAAAVGSAFFLRRWLLLVYVA